MSTTISAGITHPEFWVVFRRSLVVLIASKNAELTNVSDAESNTATDARTRLAPRFATTSGAVQPACRVSTVTTAPPTNAPTIT